uniref:GH18 domain-containing protein n=2 Tax=Corethron hystrix TaxID=216773 RepID=A0A7S1FKC4_9STRA|mmetsp:Transcript_11379/g.24976  ORF Transcript_11379/g.24976 Transcript_11379/m.24976 type:complete len:185 (+) Transcript_11379:482-1036(+)
MYLIVEASDVFHQNGLLITIALHPRQFLPKQVYEYIDQVHLMTYDMIQKNGHHASYENAFAAVEALINNGCHPSKIIMGLPAYGRDKLNPSNVRTYSEALTVENPKLKFNEDTSSILENSSFGFDSQELILDKVKTGVHKKLGGFFIWEVGQDFKNDFVGEGLMLRYVNDAILKISTDGMTGEL